MRRSTSIAFCLFCCLFLALAITTRISFAHYGTHHGDGYAPSHKPDHSHKKDKKDKKDKKESQSKLTKVKAKAAVVALALAQDTTKATAAEAKSIPGISGQGKLKFKVLYTRDHLPAEAVKVLERAHGGFAVDRRSGKGEVYFALPGAGIIQISGDLKTTRLLDTPPEVKNTNMHNTTIWYEIGRAHV